MKTYELTLQAPMSDSFRGTMAAQSLDIDVKKKSLHQFKVQADLETPFSIGLIVGASGSGKTTLAREVFGKDCFKEWLDPSKAVIDQFPEGMPYEDCARSLTGIGLSSVPCWLKPAGTLSNGQRARAEAALAIVSGGSPILLDEWTSVVDRTVAKVMSHCIQKFARRSEKRVILLSCHYDVIDWLDPDWIVDCNAQKFVDRRLLRPDERRRKEQLQFTIREVTRSSWPRFAKYHYLSQNMPGGKSYFYGLFHGENQIGFNAFSNYVPHVDRSKPRIYHVHRTVIHPDYAGMGLGIHMDTETSRHVAEKYGYRVMAKFSSTPFYRMMSRHPEWRMVEVRRQVGRMHRGETLDRQGGFRENVKTYSFEFVPKAE